MKKVININFQGRVIPIEESAFETLNLYIESLRRYFAHEEGREEIINDIEGRIAELFSEILKKGSTCITSADLDGIITSMGRPEDFDAQDADTATGNTYQESRQSYTGAAATGATYNRGRLYRNEDDKILGGVCSGLANYMGIDPVIMRIIFVVLFGALFWVYILLWIIVPSKSIQSNITKRLYRSTDDKMIAGVAGGLAAYFHIDTWIPRLIFVLPFILGLVSGSFNDFWFDWDFGVVPRIISGSLGWTLFMTYVILWIAVPPAITAAEKLEMRGEKIDLNSIRDTVKEDLGSFKSRADRFSTEVRETAQQFSEKAKTFGTEAGERVRTFAAETAPAARKAGSGIGHVIGILFKAFFLFIAGIIALTLFGVFIAIVFGGFAFLPLKDFLLNGFTQNLLAWLALLLFLALPVVAIITWIIRRIVGVRSKNHYLGYVFGSLWTIGLIALIFLAAMVSKEFRNRAPIEERALSFQPASGKLWVDISKDQPRYYSRDWFGLEHDDEWPVFGMNNDSLLLKTVRVNLERSRDTAFNVYLIRSSRGSSPREAMQTAERIDFDMQFSDSTLLLPPSFAISKNEKFRNQQVMVVIEIPVGKRIQLHRSVRNYNWFNINYNRDGLVIEDNNDNWRNNFRWQAGMEYIMTPNGLERAGRQDSPSDNSNRLRIEDGDTEIEVDGNPGNNDSDRRYRYRNNSGSIRIKKDGKEILNIGTSSNTEAEGYDEEQSSSALLPKELGTPLSVFSRLFQ